VKKSENKIKGKFALENDGEKEKDRNRDAVMTLVFERYFESGASEVPFTLDDIRNAIAEVQSKSPGYKEKNTYDVRYHYTSGRGFFPQAMEQHGPWMIQGRGKGRYAFVKLKEPLRLTIQESLATIYLPDATPEIVLEYAGGDEQGVLAKLRYNRLLDVFLGLTCYHLQGHWRTTVKGKGQVETDDLYVGLNTDGQQFVIPVEAKSAKDNLAKTQILSSIGFAVQRYAKLILRPVGVQEMKDGSLVLIEFTPGDHPDKIKIKNQRRYSLVKFDDVPFDAQQGIVKQVAQLPPELFTEE